MRRRPGFLLIDTVLWTMVAATGLLFLVQYLEIYVQQKNVQDEARILSTLADHAADEALLALSDKIADAISAGGAVVIPITDLNAYEGWPVLPRDRGLHLVHYSPDAQTLWVLAYTRGPDAGTPRPAPGIVNLGIIDHDGPCSTSAICGPGLRWNHTAVGVLLASPPEDGSMVALRLLDADPDSDSFVWSVDTGDPVRTTMTTHLDLAGHDVVNAGHVKAQNIVPRTTVQVLGTTEAAQLNGSSAGSPLKVAGTLDINGTLTATNVASDIYTMNGNNVQVVNDIAANRLTATGTMTIEDDMNVTSNLTTSRLTGDVSASALTMVTLDATTTTVDGDVIVNRATTGDLAVTPGHLTVEGILYVTRCVGPGCSVSP